MTDGIDQELFKPRWVMPGLWTLRGQHDIELRASFPEPGFLKKPQRRRNLVTYTQSQHLGLHFGISVGNLSLKRASSCFHVKQALINGRRSRHMGVSQKLGAMSSQLKLLNSRHAESRADTGALSANEQQVGRLTTSSAPTVSCPTLLHVVLISSVSMMLDDCSSHRYCPS